MWSPSPSLPFQFLYAHADDDAVGVSLCPLGAVPSINAVWMIEHCYVEGYAAPFILLQGAAYGRYLAVSNQEASWVPGTCVLQRDYNSMDVDPRFVWRPYRMMMGYDDDLHLVSWGVYLRGDIRVPYFASSHPGIVTAHSSRATRNVRWGVEAIPPSPEPLPLPPPPPAAMMTTSDVLNVIAGRPDPKPEPLRRTVRYARANSEGDLDQEMTDWPDFVFEGRSVFDLRTRVGLRQDDCLITGITLCVLAGSNARPVPLLTDLPFSRDPMNIIIYTNGSRAASDLRYPQFDQPELL